MATINQHKFFLLDSYPQLQEFDKYKRGDTVYTISHTKAKVCGKDVSYPLGINKMYINRIAYSLADCEEAFEPPYTGVNLYLYLDLISIDNSFSKSMFTDNTDGVEMPQETIVIEIYYHISPGYGYNIPIYKHEHPNNELLDESKLSSIIEIKDKTKTDIVWTNIKDAETELGRQSDSAARAMLEILDIGAKYIKQSEKNLKDMTLDHMKGTEFLMKFVSCRCTPGFEASIRKTDEWLAVHLKGLLYDEE